MKTLRLTAILAAAALTGAAAEYPDAPNVRRFVAIDNVCAWPSLTQLGDGTLIATLHNQPAHGLREGDVECWVSADGEFWSKAGTPTVHEPNTIRMNHAAGLTGNGNVLVLCSGWTNLKHPQRPKQSAFRDDILRNVICRSSDQGKSWERREEFPAPEPGWTEYIPFGDIVRGEDGALHVSCYGGEFVDPSVSTKFKGFRSWHFRSDDDGKTWRNVSVIGPRHNETTILRLGGKRWLAAARVEAVEIFRSDDDGESWSALGRASERNQINGHLLQLKDGRILLSYGTRVKGEFGVLGRISADEGKTWGAPFRIAASKESDCGYPSSRQRADGRVVTVFYSKGAANHERYHMGVALWDVPPAN